MERINPKFQEHIRKAIRSEDSKKGKPTYGIIMTYDRWENTAQVLLSGRNTAKAREILYKVPCPVQMGVQTVDPDPGRPCWVDFKDGESSSPMVVSYMNHNHLKYDWSRKQYAGTGVPSYMAGM